MHAEIRPFRAADASAVDDLLEAAFRGRDEIAIFARTRARGALDLALVADVDGEPAGLIAFAAVSLAPAGAGLALTGLAPLAVHPDRQGMGLGKQLVWAGLERLRRRGLHAVFVLGAPAYYRHFGFRPAAPSGLTCDYPGGERHFQVLELFDGALAGARGRVRYAFDDGEPGD